MRKEQTIIYKSENGTKRQVTVLPGFPFGRPGLHEKVHSQEYGELRCVGVQANKAGESPYEVSFVITTNTQPN